MTAIATQASITPEQLLQMPDAADYELADGELVERNVSSESSRVAARVLILLGIECLRTNEAVAYANDLGYQCFPDDPGRIHRPDGSLIRRDRLAAYPGDHGYMPISADLVVEVISPNDLSYEVAAKVEQYLSAGFSLIWVIHPNVRTVTVYSQGKLSPRVLKHGDAITAEPALSEFKCDVARFFE